MAKQTKRMESASYVSAVDCDEEVKYDYVAGFREHSNKYNDYRVMKVEASEYGSDDSDDDINSNVRPESDSVFQENVDFTQTQKQIEHRKPEAINSAQNNDEGVINFFFDTMPTPKSNSALTSETLASKNDKTISPIKQEKKEASNSKNKNCKKETIPISNGARMYNTTSKPPSLNLTDKREL